MMHSLKLLVIDDEPDLASIFIEKIRSVFLSLEIAYLEKLDVNSLDQLNDSFNLIFLDFIRKGQLETVEVLKYLKDQSLINRTIVYSSYFNQDLYNTLYQFCIHSYIPRGVNAEILKNILLYKKDVENNEVMIAEAKDRISVKKGNYYFNVLIQDIEYIEVEGRYVFFFVNGEKYVYRESLKNVLEQYGNRFFRIHLNYAINLDKFVKLDYSKKRVFVGKTDLPLGRKYQKEFYQILRIKY